MAIAAVAVAVAAASVVDILYLQRVIAHHNAIASIRYTQTDISVILDGTYSGEYDADLIYAKVSVTVEDGRITDISLDERGQSAERIIDDRDCAQSVDVDAVSGATNSSSVIKKAIDNTLAGAH